MASFKYALEQMQTPDHKVVINADKRPAGEHVRRFNATSASGVAIVMVGQQHGRRDIILKHRDNHLTRIMETHRAYDTLQYPMILLSRGEDGYNFDLRQYDQKTGVKTDKSVSCLNFYAFHLMVRVDNFNHVLRFKEVISQYFVDMYAKMEAERLRYLRSNQKQLRAEQWSAGCHQHRRKCQQCWPASYSTFVLHWLSTLHERTGPGCYVVRPQTWPSWFVYNIYMQSKVGRHQG